MNKTTPPIIQAIDKLQKSRKGRPVNSTELLFYAIMEFDREHRPRLSNYIPEVNWKEKVKGFIYFSVHTYNHILRRLAEKLSINIDYKLR